MRFFLPKRDPSSFSIPKRKITEIVPKIMGIANNIIDSYFNYFNEVNISSFGR